MDRKEDELNERPNKVQEEIDCRKLLEEAIKAVKKQKRHYTNDVNEAYKKSISLKIVQKKLN